MIGEQYDEIGRNVIINNKGIHELHSMEPAQLKELHCKIRSIWKYLMAKDYR